MKNVLKWGIVLIAFIFVSETKAQSIQFSISSGYNSRTPGKEYVESNITDLLNTIQRAGKSNGTPNLQAIQMEPRAKTRLQSLWNNCHFTCTDINNIFPCITDVEGFQVRGIPVRMKPQDAAYRGEIERELVVSFNRKGIITGVSLALNNINVTKIMGEGNAVKDLSERRMIMKFLEDFRCYYNEKDTAALRAVYSDDAIIITGSVVQRKQMGDISTNKMEIRYNKQNKDQYMESIKSCFQRNKFINVEFDKIDVVKHPSKVGIYGVTLHQKWESSRYTDDGWLFLVWDFTNPEKPTIHVRTWQPWMVKENEVFSLDDFRID